mgnify:CR=1 FL=1
MLGKNIRILLMMFVRTDVEIIESPTIKSVNIPISNMHLIFSVNFIDQNILIDLDIKTFLRMFIYLLI